LHQFFSKHFNLNAISSKHLHRIKSFPLSFEPQIESFGGRLRKLGKPAREAAMSTLMPIEQAGKSRPLPYNCLKIDRNGCKNLTPLPTEKRCRASSNRNSCPSASHSLLLNNRCRAGYAIAHNFFNGNYTKACLPSCISMFRRQEDRQAGRFFRIEKT
jgi:hypothetical protein